MTKFLLLLSLALSLGTSGGGERYLKWSANQQLTWDDFQGAPDGSTDMKALTLSKLSFSWKCEDGELSYQVQAKFDRGRSWKKDIASDLLLGHEQLHFDITELYARKLRQVLSELEGACDLRGADIKAVAGEVHKAWQLRQDEYDMESDHSRDEEMQAFWEDLIAEELLALDDFQQKEE